AGGVSQGMRQAEGASCGHLAPSVLERSAPAGRTATPERVKWRSEPPERGRINRRARARVLTRRHNPSGPDAAGARCESPLNDQAALRRAAFSLLESTRPAP